MDKSDWVWMPHAAHLIVGHQCRFHLATYLPKTQVIVSTVGEYVPDSVIRKVLSESRKLGITGVGDQEEYEWLEKNGFEKIGWNRTYETMVFKAVSRDDEEQSCCPFKTDVSAELEMRGYNDPKEAYQGHLELCAEFSEKIC